MGNCMPKPQLKIVTHPNHRNTVPLNNKKNTDTYNDDNVVQNLMNVGILGTEMQHDTHCHDMSSHYCHDSSSFSHH